RGHVLAERAESLGREWEPPHGFELLRDDHVLRRRVRGIGLEGGDDASRLVEVARKRVFALADARRPNLERPRIVRELVERELWSRPAANGVPEATVPVEPAQRQKLPAMVGDEVDSVDEIREDRFADEVVEPEPEEGELRSFVPERNLGLKRRRRLAVDPVEPVEVRAGT